jgi:methylated-DNA-[protein]-cysteine S-methyltransferase
MDKRNRSKIIISTYKKGNLYFAAGFSENGKIVRIALPKENLEDAVSEISRYHQNFSISNVNPEVMNTIADMFFGENIDFELKLLEMDIESEYETSTIKTSFEREVILEVAKIPYGTVKTYKDIAKSINTNGYRAVGTAIGKNPFPIVVPCHRVIRSDHSVGGFRGGSEMKVEMLNNEGINIKILNENQPIINLK